MRPHERERGEAIALLDAPGVRRLVAQAVDASPVPIEGRRPRRLVIKSVSPRRRPRRPRARAR